MKEPAPDRRAIGEDAVDASSPHTGRVAEAGAGGGDAPGLGQRPGDGPSDVDAKLEGILTLLDDEKAVDVMPIDLRGKSSFADYMIIASGRSSRHVGAICQKLIEALKAQEGPRPRAEGVENGDWALIDASDIVIHVFRPEVREFYALEKMWAPTPTPEAESGG